MSQSGVANASGNYFLPASSSTATVIAMTPVLIVGSGSGANWLECSEGRDLPVFSLSASLSGFTAPSQNRQIGILSFVRPYSLKSSPPMTGFIGRTLVSPNQFLDTAASRRVNTGSV